ncbi:Uncharacterised protein [Pasteurella multocida]|nr:Uncharacterised protein [Pasteurella multocida]
MGSPDSVDFDFECSNCGTKSHIHFYQKGSNFSFGEWKKGTNNVHQEHDITFHPTKHATDQPVVDVAICNRCQSILKTNIK